jgi:hypothetical protein
MILKWRSVRFLAALAGGIKCDQAYHKSKSGSAWMFGRRYSKLSSIVIPFYASGIREAAGWAFLSGWYKPRRYEEHEGGPGTDLFRFSS